MYDGNMGPRTRRVIVSITSRPLERTKMNSDEVFIVGGGSSLRNFLFDKLKNKNTIAVNVAALDVPNPTYCITADSGMLRKLQEGYFKGVKTTWVIVTNPNHCTMQMRNGKFINIRTGYVYDLFCANVIIRNADVTGIGFSFDDFKTGYNSGFCGLQLAVLLGYKKIYLLGFDLRGRYYHNRYRSRKITNADFKRFYDNFILALSMIRERTNIQVISCSDVSKLNDVIPYVPIEEALAPLPLSLAIRLSPGKKRLSILICSVLNRVGMLRSLLSALKEQLTKDVEILVERDGGEITIGAKRNILLRKAIGDYVAFVDDDDKVSGDYVAKILKAVSASPDCCSMEGEIHFNSRNVTKKFVHSIRYKKWFQAGDIYYRCPNHLNPVKRTIALGVGFPNMARGEDKNYSLRLRPLLKTEQKIDGIIYFYAAS